MRVRLKQAAWAGRVFFERGIVDWPDDVPLPSTAEKVAADEVEPAPAEIPAEPDTLSELQKKGPPKK